MAILNPVSPYILITRPINLLLIVITQCAIYFGVIYRYIIQQGLPPLLSIDHFFLLVLSTVFIGSGGYIINDIFDTDIDQLNKPQKQFVGHSISFRNAWIYYWFHVLIGGFISIYLALAIDQVYLFIIYPIAVFTMYLYSYSLKRKGLMGNIIVALFCGFVPAIVVFAERDSIYFYTLKQDQLEYLQIILMAFIIFSTLGNFIREIVKDMEDVEGDTKAGARTFPVIAGIEKSRNLSIIIMLLLSVLILIWTIYIYYYDHLMLSVISALTLVAPSLFLLKKTFRLTTKIDCSKVSSGLKILMVLGLLNLILTSIFTL